MRLLLAVCSTGILERGSTAITRSLTAFRDGYVFLHRCLRQGEPVSHALLRCIVSLVAIGYRLYSRGRTGVNMNLLMTSLS